MKKTMVGNKIRIKSEIYLGRWLKPGEEGIIIAVPDAENKYYKIRIDGLNYVCAGTEFEVVK